MVPATLQKEHVTVLLTRLLDFIIMKIIRSVSTDSSSVRQYDSPRNSDKTREVEVFANYAESTKIIELGFE